MNRSKLKSYAPQARRDFIRAVTDRAAQFGLEKDKTEPIVEQGDVAIIAGKPFPRFVAAKRKRLEEQIARRGFDQFMEACGYTWFNRLMAIRFMELHGYLDQGPGTLVVTGANTYSGGTTITTGTLQVGSGGSTGAVGSWGIVNNTALVFNRTGSLTVAGNISGSGTLTQQGTGTVILTGTNTYSGGTTLQAGTLLVNTISDTGPSNLSTGWPCPSGSAPARRC